MVHALSQILFFNCTCKRVCDRPTLRSDPSYPWGTNAMGLLDPDVLWAGTNQQTLTGDSGQQQPLCVITKIEKANCGDFEEEEEDGDGEDHGSKANKGRDEFGGGGSSRRNNRSSLEETFPLGEQGRPPPAPRSSRGPEGSAPELQPRYGESVAYAGAWAGLICRGGELAGGKEVPY
ncbi:hypothetical protein NDU88_002894 [Pleurodeles waltl]|uniref:Uncharacterized protein n=1 Tax=Pleurodeles waltl TaxID=8319 RepID=A0AAV7KXE7_PLEWA|nr:hypothetical protein NDU88_002894 [Pleurodeles waltl]